MSEHWAIEQLKRIVIEAMVQHADGAGMAVSARRAADEIVALLPLPPTTELQRLGQEFDASQADNGHGLG
jgi:hypothetical protein